MLRPSRSLLFASLVATLLVTSRRARADELELPNDDDRAYQTFRYSTIAERNYFRAILEGVGVLSLGYIEYLISTSSDPSHVGPKYDWSIFHSKLSGNAQSFDINHFNTNFMGHPLGGTLYYTSARANRLGVFESSAWAVIGSTTWEYIGEITEKPSYNDMIVTPTAGISLAETFNQLSWFFSRSKPGFRNGFFATLFGVARVTHDWLDDLEPERAAELDRDGFAKDVWHRFDVHTGFAVTRQDAIVARTPAQTYPDVPLGIALRLKNLPYYDGPGKQSRVFSDGNVAELTFDATFSDHGLADARFATTMMPIGWYGREAVLDEHGRVYGHGGYIGPVIGFEYGVHDYDRDRARPHDLLSMVNLGGPRFEYTAQAGALRLVSRIDTGVNFAGVRSYALEKYVATQRSEADLPTVLRDEGYYFALGPAVAPQLQLDLGPFGVGGSFKVEDFTGVLGLDDRPENGPRVTHDVPRHDRRTTARAWIDWTIPGDRARVSLFAARLARSGEVGTAHVERAETTAGGTLSFLF